MRILMISQSYPSEQHKHSYGFVHSRSKIYQKFGNSVKVFVPSVLKFGEYKFEGVDVAIGPYAYLRETLENFDPDAIAVHAPTRSMGRELPPALKTRRFVTWFHGSEVLLATFHNYHAPWDLTTRVKSLVYGDPSKIFIIRSLIKQSAAVVYVSEWMKKMAERYTFMKLPASFVIPNPIDTDLFRCTERDRQSMYRGLSVRSLEWKYGVDIAVKAYSNLKETDLTVLGNGSLKAYLLRLAEKSRSNVHFRYESVEHNKMPSVYAEFGYFVAPSRTEAQGVAMCEAMACGLPVVATNVGGIPEFVKNGVNGLLVAPENPYELRKAIKRLLTDPALYKKLSEGATSSVKENLSHQRIYELERAVLTLCLQNS